MCGSFSVKFEDTFRLIFLGKIGIFFLKKSNWYIISVFQEKVEKILNGVFPGENGKKYGDFREK